MRLPCLSLIAPFLVVWHADFSRFVDWGEWNIDSFIAQAAIPGNSVWLRKEPGVFVGNQRARADEGNQVYQPTEQRVAQDFVSVTSRSSYLDYSRV